MRVYKVQTAKLALALYKQCKSAMHVDVVCIMTTGPMQVANVQQYQFQPIQRQTSDASFSDRKA